MTVLDALAQREARVQYERARKQHQLALYKGTPEALRHAFAYRRLVRFAASETIVVREVG